MDRDERKRLRDERKQQRDDMSNYMHANSGNRVWIGLLFLVVGGLLLAKKIGADIPEWMFSWYMLVIAIGLLICFKSGFRNVGGLIMIFVGVAFLLNALIPNADMEKFIWPGILIVAGIVFIVKPSSHDKKHWHKWQRFEEDCKKYEGSWKKYEGKPENEIAVAPIPDTKEEGAEYIEINAVFGSVNKLILSKNFKGGEINAFMGGAEVNLLQADIKQTVILEVNNVFGGTKLIVPGNWDLKNEITAVFGGVEDKRNPGISAPDPNKILVLKGACVFGGLEIRNF